MTEPVWRLRAGGLDWRVVDDEAVILDAERSAYNATNASGTVLWTRLHDGATRSELVAALGERFALERPRAEADVDAFLADLHSRGLLDES